jgi:Trypsin-like peptidase domain
MIPPEIIRAVLRVGAGRGFLVEAKHERLVITAAHCLPELPPPHSMSYTEERTYPNLLGPLGKTEPMVWAECLFGDPVADIAILSTPDRQELYDQAAAYDELTELRPSFRIDDAPISDRAWLLSLAGEWTPCRVQRAGDDQRFALRMPLWIEDAMVGIHGGMSGSPIVTDDGAAIGVLSVSGGKESEGSTQSGPNPRLADCLPGWLLQSSRV